MSRLPVIVAILAGAWASGCDGVADASVLVEVTGVPAGTTALEAVVVASDRERARVFDDEEALAAETVTFAVATDRHAELLPLEVTVTAIDGACAVARGTATCELDQPCEQVTVELTGIAPECGGEGDAGPPPIDANDGRSER